MKNLKIIIAISLIALLTGCVRSQTPNQPYAIIPALQGQTVTSNSIRNQAIQDTAFSLGAQGGLAWRSKQINKNLLKEQDSLSRIFDFNALVLKHNVLPPVLQEGDTTLNLANRYAIRLADRVYRIVAPPRFITVPPTWRDYLWLGFRAPEAPSATLLPRCEEERQIWNRCLKMGWQAGIEQANSIFSVNLGRLKRDYTGMILYRKLLAQNMVSPPFVAKLDLGVTGGGDYMRINDQVLRITAIPQLNPRSRTWRPLITKGEAGGDNPDVDQADP